MNCYIYTHQSSIESAQKLEDFASLYDFQVTQIFQDSGSLREHWSKRSLSMLINDEHKGDTIIIYDAPSLACSLQQVLEIIHQVILSRIQLIFVKYNLKISSGEVTQSALYILDLISKIESDFISSRTTTALARRRDAGLPLGRPKGRQNKSLRLDEHHDEIMRYLKLRISKASIAKLVKCHPQTLYDWIERRSALADL